MSVLDNKLFEKIFVFLYNIIHIVQKNKNRGDYYAKKRK
mgnify:CR=1 FL=1